MKKTCFAVCMLVLGLALGALPVSSDVSALRPIGGAFPIRAEAEWESGAKIAYNSQWQEYLVVFWNDRPGNDDIRAERVSKGGKLLGGRWIAAGPGADRRYPDVAYNSRLNQYLIVWEERSGDDSLIRSQRFSADLTPQPEGVKTIVATHVATSISSQPAVAYAYTADKYLVVWQYNAVYLGETDIVGHIVSSDGNPSTPGGDFTISHDTGWEPRWEPDVAYNRHANGFLVVWRQYRLDGTISQGFVWDIWSCLVDGDGPPPVFNPQPITFDFRDNTTPSVAAIPTAPTAYKFLVVWTRQERYGLSEIYAKLVAEDGTPLGSYILVDGSSAHNDGAAVAGTENGLQYLVTYSHGTVSDFSSFILRGRGLSYDGQPLFDPVPFTAPSAGISAVAAGPAGDFLVAWVRQPGASAATDLYGQLWGHRAYSFLPLILKSN